MIAGRRRAFGWLAAAGLVVWAGIAPARAQLPPEQLKAVVGIRATVPAEARTANTLGRTRSGAGVVIDSGGLVVTIGYLVIEAGGVEVVVGDKAVPATVVGVDNDTGFGLVRALAPLGVKPMPMGNPKNLGPQARLYAAGSAAKVLPVLVTSRRTFAGYWEYLLDKPLFTAPPVDNFGGAALIDPGGKLVGIGSLQVPDAMEQPRVPGNMFLPIDLLQPLMADLMTLGHGAGPSHPWLGLTSREVDGRILIVGTTADGPAARAGIAHGDVLVKLGDQPVSTLADFYRRLWDAGPAGTEVQLTVIRGAGTRTIPVKTIDRLQFLKTGITY